MGTGGCHVIKDRGYYFVWRVSNSGMFNAGLGPAVYGMVEKDPGKLKSWRNGLRKKLALLRRIYNIRANPETGRLEAETRDSQHRVDIIITEDWTYEKELYVYELDLDNMVFLYQRYPVYHLDYMPPEDVLYRSCANIDEMNIPDVIDKFYQGTPEEYRFSLSRLSQWAPEVEDFEITTYEESSIEVIMDPPRILPSSSSDLTCAEDVSLRLLASILSFYRRQQPVVMYHEIALINSRRVTGERGWALCSLFAAMALFPLHIVGLPPGWLLKEGPWYDFFSRSHEEFWFIRKHICVTFGAHLLDERNAKYHISKLIDRIVSDRDSPQVTYGVVFSLFHCIVVRIDKLAARCHLSRTEVLEFLPPLHVESFNITPGMELLTRLGHLKGEDDLDVFHSCLSPRWWMWRRPSRYPEFEPRLDVAPLNHPVFVPHAPRLPLEIMMLIASEIEQPTHLFEFALASRSHMAAAIPRLRLPQVWGRDNLALYGRTVCYILDSYVTDTVPATFETRHKDDSLLLQLRYSSRLPRKKPQRLGIMEWDGTTPIAGLMFGQGGGHSSGGYHFDDDPRHSYAEAHAEVAFVTGYRIEDGENEDEDEEEDR